MEHTQSPQYPPKPIKRRKKTQSKSISSSNIFIHLLIRHPGLLLTGLLTILMGSTAVALYSLVYAGSPDQVEPEEIAAVVETPITTSFPEKNPTPLWLVFAIALSCAGGCSMIFKSIDRRPQAKKVRKPIKVYTSKPLTINYSPKWEPKTVNHQSVFVPLQSPNHITPWKADSHLSARVMSPQQPQGINHRKEPSVKLMDIPPQTSLPTISR
ncbi:hypothetical protein [Nodularia chucula]|uniref:hypothetical protein n=1 Tax=Nodularia chucula TaxID=3093667 RepID=UPI0039C635DC